MTYTYIASSRQEVVIVMDYEKRIARMFTRAPTPQAFYCRDCGEVSRQVPPMDDDDEPPVCPDCGGRDVISAVDNS